MAIFLYSWISSKRNCMILIIMPWLFELGHQIQTDLGFTAKYDIVSCFLCQ